MPALITVADVKGVMEVPGEVTDPQLEAFISDAHIIVSEDLAGKGLSEARLAAIEKYLAAHFALQYVERGGFILSQLGDAHDKYLDMNPQGQANISGFMLSRYGQQAVVLDTSGTLKKMTKASLNARFTVI